MCGICSRLSGNFAPVQLESKEAVIMIPSKGGTTHRDSNDLVSFSMFLVGPSTCTCDKIHLLAVAMQCEIKSVHVCHRLLPLLCACCKEQALPGRRNALTTCQALQYNSMRPRPLDINFVLGDFVRRSLQGRARGCWYAPHDRGASARCCKRWQRL